jgi:hypothetical protein
MQRWSDLGVDFPDLLSFNPYHYVQEADLALFYGSREEAVALIAQAYLAFDFALLVAPSDGESGPDTGKK